MDSEMQMILGLFQFSTLTNATFIFLVRAGQIRMLQIWKRIRTIWSQKNCHDIYYYNIQSMKKKRVDNFVVFLHEQLGQGSFGKVYKGINQDNKEIVAVKVLSKRLIDNDDFIKDALVSQIKIMKKLKSQHIVGFIDILQTSHNYYVVQEFCNGGDLKSAMKKSKTFTEGLAISYLEQILLGFQQLILNSIIHRDMKPENIMIHNGKLKITDFGFAKSVLSKTQMSRSMVGTPNYMAPQVLKRQKYSSKCDIWGIAIIFYQMLFGAMPWTGKSEYELITNIMKQELTLPQNQYSENTIDFIKGCLKQQELKRFSWQQVYDHPIFNGCFHSFTQKNKKLSQKAGYVINKLRLQIHSQNIDLQKLFNKLKYEKETTLKKEQFFYLLKTLDQQIDKEEAQFVFEKFDANSNGQIQLSEFKKILTDSGVRMTSKPIQSKTSIKAEGEEQGEQKVYQIVKKLKDKIEAHKLELFTVYDSYDKNKDEVLNFQQFQKLLWKLDNTLTQAEQRICFNKFDINGDNKITYQEFYRTVCKIAGEPVNLSRKRTTKG